MTKLALLGATGHLAKGLILEFSSRSSFELTLYARRPEAVAQFLTEQSIPQSNCKIKDLESFGTIDHDAIINAIGAGDPKKVQELGADILNVTEEFDNTAMNYIQSNPKTRYIFLSSGTIYGTEFSKPAGKLNAPKIFGADSPTNDDYRLAKLEAEKKHRAAIKQCIFDIRIFAYFSRFIDQNGAFFMAELVRAIMKNKVFETNGIDMIRDFAVPYDLANLIEFCIKAAPQNATLDLYSKKPFSKFELLEAVEKKYGLIYTVNNEAKSDKIRQKYYSKDRRAEALGYTPHFSSLDGVLSELSHLLNI